MVDHHDAIQGSGPVENKLWRARRQNHCYSQTKRSGRRISIAICLAHCGNFGTERDRLLDMRQDDSRAHYPTLSTMHRNLSGSGADTTGNTPWITRAEAAEILGITAGGVGYYVRRGDLSPRRKCRHLPTLNRAEVELLAEALAEERSRRPPARPRRARHPQDGNQWLSALQVANRLGVSRLWVDIRALRGDLPYTVGPQGRRSYRADHVEAFARRGGLQGRQRAVGQPTG
jgi:hypothetical protein